MSASTNEELLTEQGEPHFRIAREAAQALGAGVSILQTPVLQMPENALRPGSRYHGLAAMALMQAAIENGWSPYWITANGAARVGAEVRPEERDNGVTVPIAFTSAKRNGKWVRLAEPEIINVTLYNASQVDGLPAREPAPAKTTQEREEAERLAKEFKAAEPMDAEGIPGSTASVEYRLAHKIARAFLSASLGVKQTPLQDGPELEGYRNLLFKEPLSLSRAAAKADRQMTRYLSNHRDRGVKGVFIDKLAGAIVEELANVKDEKIATMPPAERAEVREKMLKAYNEKADDRGRLDGVSVKLKGKEYAEEFKKICKEHNIERKWHNATASWYVPEGTDLSLFASVSDLPKREKSAQGEELPLHCAFQKGHTYLNKKEGKSMTVLDRTGEGQLLVQWDNGEKQTVEAKVSKYHNEYVKIGKEGEERFFRTNMDQEHLKALNEAAQAKYDPEQRHYIPGMVYENRAQAQKDVKAAGFTSGAHFDREAKAWFVNLSDNGDLSKLEKYAKAPEAAPALSPAEQARDVMVRMGVDPKELPGGLPEIDGKEHRVALPGDKQGETSFKYRLYSEGYVPAGYFHNFKTGEDCKWKALGKRVDAAALDEVKAKVEETKARNRAELDARHAEGAKAAQETISSLQPLKGQTPYTIDKGIHAHAGMYAGPENSIVVPFVNPKTGEVRTAQTIDAEGRKRFNKGGQKWGNCCVIGGYDNLSRAGDSLNPAAIVIAEGVATASTLAETVPGVVAVAAGDCGNLKPVAENLRAAYPGATIIIAADNDSYGKKNTGKEAAERAAQAVGGIAILPSFTKADLANAPEGKKLTDFNDLAKYGVEGKHGIFRQFERALIQKAQTQAQAPAQQAQTAAQEVAMDVPAPTSETNRFKKLLNQARPQGAAKEERERPAQSR